MQKVATTYNKRSKKRILNLYLSFIIYSLIKAYYLLLCFIRGIIPPVTDEHLKYHQMGKIFLLE